MEKMRWFIIGNLIGFGVLIFGIGINESIKHKSAEQQTDKPVSPVNEQQSSSKTGQSTLSSQQANASTGVATGTNISATEPGGAVDTKNTKSATNPTDAKNTQESEQNSQDVTSTENVKTEARLVTTRDINKGTILHAGDLELRQVDVKRASKDGLTKFDMALGYKTRIDLIEGEMLQPSDLQTRENE